MFESFVNIRKAHSIIYKSIRHCQNIQINVMSNRPSTSNRPTSSHSTECLESTNLKHDLKVKWRLVGSPIAFAGISKIYNYYNKQISKKEIEHILSTFPTYTRYKEVKKIKKHNPYLLYYKHQQWQLTSDLYIKFKNLE